MVAPVIEVDESALAERGFTILPKVVPESQLVEFEDAIRDFCRGEIERRAISPVARDPLIDLFLSSDPYREKLFPLLRNLRSVQAMASAIGRALEDHGHFEHWGFRTPMVWPNLRVDLPNEEKYLLPMHQDYASCHCRRAWRLWVPLRDADRVSGTMKIVPGTHREGILPHDISDPAYPGVPESECRNRPVEELTVSAGDGVLFSPFLVHGSVANRSDRIKFVMLVQIQDLSTMFDPDDASDEMEQQMRAIHAVRAAAEATGSGNGSSS